MSNLQDQVRELYNKVQEQKASIAAAERPCYVTDGVFRYSDSGQSFDIRTVRHTSKLQEMLAFLLGKERDFNEAGKALGVENTFTWHGATREQWENDLKIRASQLELTNRRETLAGLEKKLLKIATPEFLAELELASIKEALGA